MSKCGEKEEERSGPSSEASSDRTVFGRRFT